MRPDVRKRAGDIPLTTGALWLITSCMIGVMVVIGVFGPSSRDLETDGAGH